MFTYDYGDYYKILPNLFNWADEPKRIKDGKKVAKGFQYKSNKNSNTTIPELQKWLSANSTNWKFNKARIHLMVYKEICK